MKRHTQLLIASVLLLTSSATYASLTNAWWSASGGLVCSNTSWSVNGGDLTMYGVQSGSATMLGQFDASDATDPRATKTYYIDNASGQTWVGYNVAAYMDQAFSISNVVTTLPGDWTFSVTQPVHNATPLYYGASEYVGYISYYSGTPVANGQELDFAYDVGFNNALVYHFEDTLSPVVPEPGVLSLILLGAGAVGAWGRARRRQNSP